MPTTGRTQTAYCIGPAIRCKIVSHDWQREAPLGDWWYLTGRIPRARPDIRILASVSLLPLFCGTSSATLNVAQLDAMRLYALC